MYFHCQRTEKYNQVRQIYFAYFTHFLCSVSVIVTQLVIRLAVASLNHNMNCDWLPLKLCSPIGGLNHVTLWLQFQLIPTVFCAFPQALYTNKYYFEGESKSYVKPSLYTLPFSFLNWKSFAFGRYVVAIRTFANRACFDFVSRYRSEMKIVCRCIFDNSHVLRKPYDQPRSMSGPLGALKETPEGDLYSKHTY